MKPGEALKSAGRSVGNAIMAVVFWFIGFFDGTKPEQSMKRALMALAGFTLCRGTIMICKAIAHAIYVGQQVDQNSVYALGVLAVPVAGLAGIVYIFRKDGPSQAGSSVESTETTSSTTTKVVTPIATPPQEKPCP